MSRAKDAIAALPEITVLHAFQNYLAPTENWASSLINQTPRTKRIVAARKLLLTNLFDPDTTYLPLPLYGPLPNPQRSRVVNLYNRAHRLFLKHYPAFLAKVRPDVDLIHAHFGNVGYFYRRLRELLDKPLVVSFYGRDYEHVPFVDPSWVPKYQELFRLADCFVCEGPHGARTLVRIGCPEEKIVVNSLGVRPDHIPVHSRGKEPGQLNLLQIAAITGKKGQPDALEAFVTAQRTCPNMTLTFVGSARADKDRAIVQSLHKRVTDSGLGDRVTFIDRIDYARLYDFLAGYHIFIHPSVHTADQDCEGGAPVVLLDAQATGMPIVATTHCDIPSEVIHGSTGLLSDEHDVPAIAADIQRFYAMDQQEYRAFGKRAREHVARNYDIAKNAASLRLIYEDVINAFSGQRGQRRS